MDPKLEKHMQEFVEDIQQFALSGIEERMQKKVISLEQNCYEQYPSNVDKFATCMQSETKKIQKESQRFESKINFFTRQMVECLQKESTDNGYNNCKLNGKNDFKKAVDDMFTNLR